MLKVAVKKPEAQATIRNLNARIGAWWVMSAIFGLTLVVGQIGSLVLFGIMSLLALREYVTLLPTRRADHRALFWSFFIFTPLQYFLIGIHWYGMFAILIPVYAFLYVPTRLAHRRRYRIISAARRDDSMGTDGLHLLPQLHSRAC